MKTIAEYGSKKIEKANSALEAIKNGGTFNGTVYAKAVKKSYVVSVYVSGAEFCIGEIQPQDVEAVKAEFLAAVTEITCGKTSTKKVDETKVFGTEAWLYSGMNAE